METEKKYALLIDADNVSPKYMDCLLYTSNVSERTIYRYKAYYEEMKKAEE